MSSCAATQSRFRRWHRARQWKMSERRRSAGGSAPSHRISASPKRTIASRDAGLRVPDDADLEDDLGAIRIREALRDDECGGFLERGHGAVEIARSDPDPCLTSQEARAERAPDGKTAACAHSPQRSACVVVSRCLDEGLGLVQRPLEAQGVGA